MGKEMPKISRRGRPSIPDLPGGGAAHSPSRLGGVGCGGDPGGLGGLFVLTFIRPRARGGGGPKARERFEVTTRGRQFFAPRLRKATPAGREACGEKNGLGFRGRRPPYLTRGAAPNKLISLLRFCRAGVPLREAWRCGEVRDGCCRGDEKSSGPCETRACRV